MTENEKAARLNEARDRLKALFRQRLPVIWVEGSVPPQALFEAEVQKDFVLRVEVKDSTKVLWRVQKQRILIVAEGVEATIDAAKARSIKVFEALTDLVAETPEPPAPQHSVDNEV